MVKSLNGFQTKFSKFIIMSYLNWMTEKGHDLLIVEPVSVPSDSAGSVKENILRSGKTSSVQNLLV